MTYIQIINKMEQNMLHINQWCRTTQDNLGKPVHTHIRLTAFFSGLFGWAGTRKVKPIWISLKQETVSGSGISWAVYKSAPRSRQITMPAPHHSVVLQAGCPSCRPTNSVKALKAWYNSLVTTLSQKKFTHMACYNFQMHEQILIIFWQRCCWGSKLSKCALSFHPASLVLLHYLAKCRNAKFACFT